MGALESEILYNLLDVMNNHSWCEIEMFSTKQQRMKKYSVLPLKIYVSTYNGRRYVMMWSKRYKEVIFYRLDKIKSVKLLNRKKTLKSISHMQLSMKNIYGVYLHQEQTILTVSK